MTRPLVTLPARTTTVLGIACAIALVLIVAGVVPAPRWPAIGSRERTAGPALDRAAASAEGRMRAAARVIHEAKLRAGVFVDRGGPPEHTALVGSELTPLVTTLGSLEVKRLAALPAWAHRLTIELARAGVGPGTSVTAAFSGSFPGLNLAVACASQALGARLLAVSSVTASTWGATDPGFTWPEMEARLVEAGVISAVSVAISVGGDADLGLDLEPDGRALAASIADDTAVRLHAVRLRAGSIDEAVRQRVALFDRRAGSLPIVAFVNVGGTAASLGREEGVLRLQSGWLIGPLPADAGNGLLAHVARRGTPVLHLLNIRQLAALWGIAG